MNIVFGFVGGCLDDKVISSGNSAPQTADADPSLEYYFESGCGEVGGRFNVPHRYGFDIYEVVRRLENGNSVIVRARYVGHEDSPPRRNSTETK